MRFSRTVLLFTTVAVVGVAWALPGGGHHDTKTITTRNDDDDAYYKSTDDDTSGSWWSSWSNGGGGGSSSYNSNGGGGGGGGGSYNGGGNNNSGGSNNHWWSSNTDDGSGGSAGGGGSYSNNGNDGGGSYNNGNGGGGGDGSYNNGGGGGGGTVVADDTSIPIREELTTFMLVTAAAALAFAGCFSAVYFGAIRKHKGLLSDPLCGDDTTNDKTQLFELMDVSKIQINAKAYHIKDLEAACVNFTATAEEEDDETTSRTSHSYVAPSVVPVAAASPPRAQKHAAVHSAPMHRTNGPFIKPATTGAASASKTSEAGADTAATPAGKYKNLKDFSPRRDLTLLGRNHTKNNKSRHHRNSNKTTSADPPASRGVNSSQIDAPSDDDTILVDNSHSKSTSASASAMSPSSVQSMPGGGRLHELFHLPALSAEEDIPNSELQQQHQDADVQDFLREQRVSSDDSDTATDNEQDAAAAATAAAVLALQTDDLMIATHPPTGSEPDGGVGGRFHELFEELPLLSADEEEDDNEDVVVKIAHSASTEEKIASEQPVRAVGSGRLHEMFEELPMLSADEEEDRTEDTKTPWIVPQVSTSHSMHEDEIEDGDKVTSGVGSSSASV